MTVGQVTLPEMVFDAPPGGVAFQLEEMEVQGSLEWVGAFDIPISVKRDIELTVPALKCDHAGGGAFDAWLGWDASDVFYLSCFFTGVNPSFCFFGFGPFHPGCLRRQRSL